MATSSVRVIKFWTAYINRAGKTIPRDMVEFCAVGMANKATCVSPVKLVSAVREPAGSEDIAAFMANDIWNQIKPLYDAWKKGDEAPENGTPLGAWPGINQEQAQVLKANGFRTVEEIALASDSALGRVQLPNVRFLIEQAKAFLESADTGKVAASLAAKDAEIARLREDQEEMKRILLDMQEAQKPRRGRPPKADHDDAEAAA